MITSHACNALAFVATVIGATSLLVLLVVVVADVVRLVRGRNAGGQPR